MVNIPQITRDRLASSVVGTPGIDTSSQQTSIALAGAAKDVVEPLANFAIARQQALDTTEANRLFTDYKMNTVNSFEKIKIDYANNPEAAGPAFIETMQDHLAATTKSASNPRVGLLVGRGDPYFDGIMVRQQQQWALAQREGLDKAAIIDQGNNLADTAQNIGADPNTPYVVKKQNLLPLFSAAGNLSAGAFAAAHPASAAELQNRIGPTIMTRAIYGMMQSNPAQAVQFTQEPEVQKAFESNPKELETLHNASIDRLKGLAGQEKWNSIAQPLVDSPDVVRDVANGKVSWADLDQMPQTELVNQLKKMSLETSPKSIGEQQQAISDFYSRAHDLGIGIKKGEEKPEVSVAQLVDFQTDLAKAYNGGTISKATYMNMTKQIAAPLIGAVMNAHEPSLMERMKNRIGSWMTQKPEKPEDIVDKYTAGYGVINKWLEQTGNGQNWRAKTETIQKYLDFSDRIGPNDRDAAGRPYTPQTLAQKVMGIAFGDTVNTPMGPLVVSGHKSDGTPTFKLTKEQQEQFDHLKAARRQ